MDQVKACFLYPSLRYIQYQHFSNHSIWLAFPHSFKIFKTDFVFCPLKTSIISKINWPSLSKRRRSLSTYGNTVSWINLMLSVVLLKCFTLALRENDSGNLVFGMLWAVFAPYINCIEKKLLEKVLLNIAVSDFLYITAKKGSKSLCDTIKPFFTNTGIVTNDSTTLEENGVLKIDPRKTTEVFNNYYINIVEAPSGKRPSSIGNPNSQSQDRATVKKLLNLTKTIRVL